MRWKRAPAMLERLAEGGCGNGRRGGAQLRMLRLELLHAVFTKQALTGLEGLTDAIGRHGLADCHQRNFPGLSSGAKRGYDDSLPNSSNVFGYGHANRL